MTMGPDDQNGEIGRNCSERFLVCGCKARYRRMLREDRARATSGLSRYGLVPVKVTAGAVGE